jgi:hypothetical protein
MIMEVVVEAYNEEFARKHAENSVQKMAFELCDTCTVDPLDCGSRYGNLRRCRLLGEKMDKLFEHPE